MPNEVVVIFRDGVSRTQVDEMLLAHGMSVVDVCVNMDMYTIKFPPSMTLGEAMCFFEGRGDVITVSNNFYVGSYLPE